MNSKHNKNLTPNSQNLRKNMTPEEKRLWYNFLRDLPITVNRQKIIGKYIVDFYCAERKTVIDSVSHVIPFDNDKVDFRVDPSMIAGIRVQSTTYFYDNSLKRKLNDLNGYLHKQINMK